MFFRKNFGRVTTFAFKKRMGQKKFFFREYKGLACFQISNLVTVWNEKKNTLDRISYLETFTGIV